MRRHLAVLLIGAALGSDLRSAEASIPSTRSGRRWALIVSTGAASRDYASDLARVLSESYGFSGEALVTLNERDATAERIQEAMASIRTRLEPYDSLFVYLSLDQRPDAGGGFSFIPTAGTEDPWTWIPARAVFVEWLSTLPVGSALVAYPGCPSKFDEYLASELAYGKRPGAIELLRACELDSPSGRGVFDPRGFEKWRVRLLEKMVELLRSSASRRSPLLTKDLAGLLEQSLAGAGTAVRRIPEYVKEAFAFEPATRGVAGEQSRYRVATTVPDREAALRNILSILKSASNAAGESQSAARFLQEVALSPTASVETPLDASSRLRLRTAAVEVLGELPGAAAHDALAAVVQLARDAPWVRRAALTQLSRLTPVRPADLEAVRSAFSDSDASVRETAVRAAVILNDRDALPALEGRLRTEGETAVRLALMQALPTLGTGDRAPFILLLADPDVAIRREAATALGRLRADASATAALLERVRADPSDEVRRHAVFALAEAWTATSSDPVYANVAPALLEALARGPGQVREAVAYALGRIAAPQAEVALRDLLRSGETEAERIAAAKALGELNSVAAIPDLAAAIRDADRPGLRREAASALGRIGTPAALDPLVSALDDRDPFVQRQAAQSLEKMPLTTEALIAGLRHASPRARLAAVRRAARETANPEISATLIELLGDPEIEVRQAAEAALGYELGVSYQEASQAGASLALLVKAARSGDRQAQFSALSVLATVPDLDAVKAVMGIIDDSRDVALRSAALGALRQQVEWLRREISAVGAHGALRAAMEQTLAAASTMALRATNTDEPTPVRKAATQILAALPDGRARLEELAKSDRSPEVKAAAIEQLRRANIQQRK